MENTLCKKMLTATIVFGIIFGQIGIIGRINNTQAKEEAIISNIEQEDSEKVQQNVNKKNADKVGKELSKFKNARELEYVPGEVIVKFKTNRINLRKSSDREKSEKFAQSRNLTKEEDLEEDNIFILKINDAKTVKEKIAELEQDSNVEYAQPNFQYHHSSIDSNDTYKSNLWGLDNTGQIINGIAGTSDADIDAPEAWTINEGTNADMIVAVIDDGVAYNHPDLIDNMWDGTSCKDENGIYLGNCNHGYDFEDLDKTPLPTSGAHGTHIAGTIAAAKNNSTGIMGAAPQAKIMAIKIALTTADAIKGINFAKQNGAKIINASWTGTSYDSALRNAISTFPGLFVAAAGNEAKNNDGGTHSYPSDFDLDNIISVTATTPSDGLAYFSNYGATSVDIGAPGINIYSTVSGSSIQGTSALYENFETATVPNIPAGWIKEGTNNNWGTYNSEGFYGNVLYGDLNSPYADNADTSASSPVYDLSSSTGATISFVSSCDTEYNPDYFYDFMALEYSNDGGTSFNEILKWDEYFIDWINGDSDSTGSATYDFTLNIPEEYLINNFKFRLRWRTNASSNDYSGCFIDNINIKKYTDGSEENYDYASGTSMATPHVTGLAALVWGYKPTLTAAQVKNIILDTGDSLSALAGKTVSEKRINAGNALNWLTPTAAVSYDITDPTNKDVIATLHPNEVITVTSEGGLTHTFNANGSFTFEFTDTDGNTGSVIATVNNIDKTAPIITINPYDDDTPTNQNIIITASTNDGILNFNSHTFTANGSFGFTATDAVGNVAIEIITITNIDKNAPVIYMNGNSAINVILNNSYTDAGAIAIDNFDSSVIVTSSGTVDINTLGSYVITYSAEDTAGNTATAVRTVNVVNQLGSEKSITSVSFMGSEGNIDEENHTVSLIVPYGTNIAALAPVVMVSAGASVTPGSQEARDFSSPQIYTVTAEDNSASQSYVVNIAVASNPDVALLAADKEALTESYMLGTNISTSEIIAALANPLPAFGFINGSNITWTSSSPQTISNNGQTVIRPSFSTGDAAVAITATFAKGTASDIKTFNLTVKKLPVSTNVSIISSVYTIEENNINGVPFGTSKASFLANISKGESHQTWDSANLSDPTETGNTLTVTAEDGITSMIYNIATLSSSEKNILSFSLSNLSPAVVGNIRDTAINLAVPYGTDITALTPTIVVSPEASINPASEIAQNFSSAKIYTVTAADNSTKNYTVTVTINSRPNSSGGGGSGSSLNTVTPTVNKVAITAIEENKLTLAIDVKNAAYMAISDSSDFTDAIWETYNTNCTYIKKENQTKLYLRFKSSSNKVSSVIELDIPANVAVIPTTNSPYLNGTLLKISSSFKVYVIIDGKKKWISTPEVFEQLGYGWTDIKQITKEELDAIPDYEDNLIRQIEDYKVYLVVNGIKRHIPNPKIFLDYGFDWSDVKNVEKAIIDKYQSTFLIKESGQNDIYYLTLTGAKKLIPTLEIFDSYNDKRENIQIISKTEMDSYPTSDLVKLNDYKEVYLIEGKIKKYIPSPEIFNKYNLNWNYITSINETEFNWYQNGGELQ